MIAADASAIARAEEGRLTETLLAVVPEIYPDQDLPCAVPIDEGAALSCGGDPWWDYAVGLGVERPIERATLDELIGFYRERNAAPKIYVTSWCDEASLDRLAERGFTLSGAWHLWARRVEPVPHEADPTRVTLVELGKADSTTLEGMCAVASQSFGDASSMYAAKYGVFARRPDYVGVAAIIEGRIVGQAWAHHGRDVVSCFGGAVLLEARGLGVQRAMLRWRIAWAKRRGARWVTVQTAAGIPTERNAARLGFELAYARLRLVARRSLA